MAGFQISRLPSSVVLLKTLAADARLPRLDSSAPIRSRAVEEGPVQISAWAILLFFAVLCVCLFSGLGALGLVGPDEPRYAAIARTMAETHDWVTPRLWGSPWFEKPVLYYWAAGISMRLFGFTEFAARFPSALAALLAVLAIGWTALRVYGVEAAYFSLLMLPTSVAFVGFSRAASTDMLFSGLLAATLAVAMEILMSKRPGAFVRIAFGFFLGAAVLAKGPAAILLAGGATLLWAALSRNWTAPFRFLHPLIIGVFCLTALPWYVICALRNPDFFRVFILQHNFARYLTPVFEHTQPFWFYVPILFLAMCPWILFLIPAARGMRFRATDSASPTLFALCWAVFPFLFFSFSQSKLPGYILPAIPPLFLVLSRAAACVFSAGKTGGKYLTGVTGALFILAAYFLRTAAYSNGEFYGVPTSRTAALLVLLGTGGAIVAGFGFGKRPRIALTALMLIELVLLAFINTAILPRADARISARAAAVEAQHLAPAAQNLAAEGLNRNWQYGLNYYFAREIPQWTPGNSLPEWLFVPEKEALELARLNFRAQIAGRAGAPFAVLVHISQ
jgi:4-amino-4-deoxy-L-arabinose transferase-like glycosyltransferase